MRNVSPERFLFEIFDFSQVMSREKHMKMPLLRYRGEKGAFYENRTEKAGKAHRDLVR